MGIEMNGYELLAPFQNKNAGFSRWTFAKRKNMTYFLKEFINPVYPIDNVVSESIRNNAIRDCEEFQLKKSWLYKTINGCSDGNLVRIFEFFRFDSHYYIATEQIDNVTEVGVALSSVPMEDRIFLCKSITHALMKLHEKKIVHADIKKDNILLTKSANGKYIGKIIDFDCSFFEDEPPIYEDELGGDQVYLSPEACMFMCGDSVKLTCKMDVFALGVLFHEYLTGMLPGFDKDEYDYAFEAVLDEQKLELSDSLSSKLKIIINGMLELDIEKRFSLNRVYELLEELEDRPVVKPSIEVTPKINKGEKWFVKGGDLI